MVLSKNAANRHEVLEENMYTCPPEEDFQRRICATAHRYGNLCAPTIRGRLRRMSGQSRRGGFDNMMVMSISSVIVQETHGACPDERSEAE
ncbi:hypothetical protein J2X69_003360 [Algoriphagus sp. 4150]|uniref:hypothetical protein n=1 Tax=Algoriphagus sp. 4150 TaxID=2817756 RepID=UPI002860DAE3|nr:hypothetical protein [Algoriphagus sp. 4150]MDR7131001.1 hypothetical protein [Algoriphagus sp. 4150]